MAKKRVLTFVPLISNQVILSETIWARFNETAFLINLWKWKVIVTLQLGLVSPKWSSIVKFDIVL